MIVLVVGTGTDVGKTHVTCALLRAAVDGGVAARAWKPVASGAHDAYGEDAVAHGVAARTAPVRPLHAFAPAVSPHLAARGVGVHVHVESIVDHARAMATTCELLFIETAGGLFSPINDAHANDQLARALAPQRVLLVAPDRIGVIHDLAATLIAGAARRVEPSVTVLSSPRDRDASTGTNAAELSVCIGCQVSAVFPRASFDADASRAPALATLHALSVSLPR